MLEQISHLIKERRGSKGLRQVASEMNISLATLSRIEAGKQPNLESFAKICVWLEINPGKILGYKKHEKSAPKFGQSQIATSTKINETTIPEITQHLGMLILAIHRSSLD